MSAFKPKPLMVKILGGACCPPSNPCDSSTGCVSTSDCFDDLLRGVTGAACFLGPSGGLDSHVASLSKRLEVLEAKLDAVLETPESRVKRRETERAFLQRIRDNVDEEIAAIDQDLSSSKDEE